MRRFPLIDAPRQTFSVVLNHRRCTITLAYNVTVSRWMLDLSIDSAPTLHGRRLVIGVDVLRPFNLGLGAIWAGDYEGGGTVPDYDALVSGRVRLYHATPVELAAAMELAA